VPYLDGDGFDGRTCRLRTINQADYSFIREMEMHPNNLVRYRHRGATIGPEAHFQNLWQGVLAQFLVESKITMRPIGVVAAYNAELGHGRCSLATISQPSPGAAEPQLEGTRLFIDYLFRVFPLRKITASIIDFNWPRFASGEGRIFVEEGLLRQHEFHDGQYWDVHLVAVYRDQWMETLSLGGSERLGILSSDLLSFERFVEVLSTEFGWDCAGLSPSTKLIEDLGCDSIALVELIDLLDDLARTEVNDEVFAGIESLGQLWQLALSFGSSE
jgi:acyl carrier protein